MERTKLDLGDLETLCEELHPVERRWHNVGLQLNVPVTDLQRIKSEYKNDHTTCLRRMLKKWLKSGNASWERLCDVLKLVGDDTKLAGKLLEKYCGKTEGDDSTPRLKRTTRMAEVESIIAGASITLTERRAMARRRREVTYPAKLPPPDIGSFAPAIYWSPPPKSSFESANITGRPMIPIYDPFSAISSPVQTKDIRGVEVSASTVVAVTANQQSFTWKEYGLKLHIPDECLPVDINECKITIMVSIAGQYDFPENCDPLSAIFWHRSEPLCIFVKPVTLEMDHCAKRENTSKLHFVRAVCSQKQLPYTFRKLKDGVFNQHTSYGIVELHSFSGIGVVQEGSTEIEREYCAMLFYLGKTILSCEFQIHFVVTWDTKTHLSVVNENYQKKQAQSGHTQPIDFESDQIMLDIPMSGVTSGGWKISPFFPPVIIKKKVDNFEPGKMIPSCQLKATFVSSHTSGIPSLQYCVKLLGAKKPYDMFNIIPSTTATTSTSTERKETVSNQVKPKLKDLLTELLTKVPSKWENIGTMLDIEEGQLYRIKADRGSDSAGCLREMLQIWLNQVEPSPSWSMMAMAIENVGNAELARYLRTKYCGSS